MERQAKEKSFDGIRKLKWKWRIENKNEELEEEWKRPSVLTCTLIQFTNTFLSSPTTLQARSTPMGT